MAHRSTVKRPRYDALVIAGAALAAVLGVCLLRFAPGVTGITIELKILAIAFAVGLDVLALSIAIGIMQLPWSSRIRLGASFCAAEVIMQVIGYGIGTGAGHIVGTIADYVGFAILAAVGVFVVRESYGTEDTTFKVDSGWGLVAASAS
ncbi:MAG TPA: manganese efflux pump, partial [Candidatus Tumulicola sp.]